MLQIFGQSASINVRKVLWTCAEIGLPYAQEQWGGGARSCREPAFLRLNPNAMVPVIQDGDLVLWESNTICRYLAGRHARADLLPADPASRARVEKWMDWQLAELNGAWRYAFMALVRRSPAHQDGAAVAASVASWNKHMLILEDRLAHTGAFVEGEGFTLADIVLGLSVHRWLAAPIERLPMPAVAAYYERLSEREGYRLHGRNGLP